MQYSNYPHGFSNGESIREQVVANLYSGKANVFWVDSNKGSDSNKGTFIRPFATLAYALTQCLPNNGDIIMLAEAHAETLTSAGAIGLITPGISIVGLGTGNNRPTFTFAASAAASLIISATATDTYFYNIRFTCNIASQTEMILLTAQRCIFDTCYFAEGSATGLAFINVGLTANDSDLLRIYNCEFHSMTNGNYMAAINLMTAQNGVQIRDCYFNGYYGNATLYNPTGAVCTNLYIKRNSIRNLNGGSGYAVNLVSACTGRMEDNDLYANAFATTLGSASLFCINNYASNAANSGSTPIPALSSSATTSTGAGTYVAISKTFTSNAITTTPVALTQASVGGDMVIDNIIVKTDATTGLAGGTNFEVTTNNATGNPIILAETVANLGAAKTVDLNSASVVKQRTVLESGKILQVQMTGANGTGTGQVTVYVVLRRVAAGSSVVSA